MRLPYNGNYPVTSSYQDHVNGGRNPGTDIGLPVGTPILASVSGRVEALYDSTGGGYFARIWGEDGNIHELLHLRELPFLHNVRVVEGQHIGYSGASGNVTGAHLHWGCYRAGAHPLAWIDAYSIIMGGSDSHEEINYKTGEGVKFPVSVRVLSVVDNEVRSAASTSGAVMAKAVKGSVGEVVSDGNATYYEDGSITWVNVNFVDSQGWVNGAGLEITDKPRTLSNGTVWNPCPGKDPCDDQLQSLKAELDTVKRQIGILGTTNADLSKRLEELNQRYVDLQAIADQRAIELRSNEMTINEMKKKIADLTADNARLKSEVALSRQAGVIFNVIRALLGLSSKGKTLEGNTVQRDQGSTK